MSRPLCFEDVHAGDRWRSHARTITEADVVNFACLTGDCDPLHVDHQYASETPFRRPIAHGLLGLSFTAGLGIHCPWMSTVAFAEIHQWRFIEPIYVGDTVHVMTEVLEKQPRGRRQGAVTWKRQLVNQDDAVVQEGTYQTLVALTRANRQIAGKVFSTVGEETEFRKVS